MKAIDVLKNELECIKRQNGGICDNKRDCQSCDLVMDDKDIIFAYEKAISALKKQIWKKPYEDYNGEIHKDKCPTCHRRLFPNEHHCKCGQALDWSDVK